MGGETGGLMKRHFFYTSCIFCNFISQLTFMSIGSINNKEDARVLAMQQVIRKLRHDDLNDGHCFMIFDDGLPEGQAYYEYPDGSIRVEQMDKFNLDIPRIVISELDEDEIASLKEKHEVFR